MVVDHVGGHHPAGQTSGSEQRPTHDLARPLLTFDLAAELERLHNEESWRRNRRNAKTLVKESDFRVVLVALHAGAWLEEHHAPGRISIHTVRGHVRVRAKDQVVDLPVGHMLTLEQNIAHDVEAQEESAFLLTIAWPAGGSTTPAEQAEAG